MKRSVFILICIITVITSSLGTAFIYYKLTIYDIKKIEVDALGHEQTVLAEEPPQPGKNLVLTLDLEAQKKLEGLLKNMLAKTNKKRADGSF